MVSREPGEAGQEWTVFLHPLKEGKKGSVYLHHSYTSEPVRQLSLSSLVVVVVVVEVGVIVIIVVVVVVVIYMRLNITLYRTCNLMQIST